MTSKRILDARYAACAPCVGFPKRYWRTKAVWTAAIGGVERGERNLSLLAIEKIALGLNINLSELFAECANAARKSRRLVERS
jgi:hypothetical protein